LSRELFLLMAILAFFINVWVSCPLNTFVFRTIVWRKDEFERHFSQKPNVCYVQLCTCTLSSAEPYKFLVSVVLCIVQPRQCLHCRNGLCVKRSWHTCHILSCRFR
jgi:hypothetical protein